jgi:hypothetical protein
MIVAFKQYAATSVGWVVSCYLVSAAMVECVIVDFELVQ